LGAESCVYAGCGGNGMIKIETNFRGGISLNLAFENGDARIFVCGETKKSRTFFK